MAAALGWGALAASSLVIGAVLAFVTDWPKKLIGSILAFGAGALISAVSISLTQEGIEIGSPRSVGIGLALGALTYFFANRALAARSRRQGGGEGGGTDLALGSFLDGIPEQIVLGVGIAAGQGVSVALLMAIFVSNLPEGIGSAEDMHQAGTSKKSIIRLFVAIGVLCTIACVAGYAIADNISGELQGAVNGFAAGALLVMLIDSMIPEARSKAGDVAGLVTVVGFAVAVGLASV